MELKAQFPCWNDALVVDVGVVPLILDGKVKIKNGVEVEKFTPNGVVFTDGSEQEADVVVFA